MGLIANVLCQTHTTYLGNCTNEFGKHVSNRYALCRLNCALFLITGTCPNRSSSNWGDFRIRKTWPIARLRPIRCDDEYEAMEVRDHRWSTGGKLELQIYYESASGDYENFEKWAAVAVALVDCIDGQPKNLVVEYARMLEDKNDSNRLLESIQKAFKSSKILTTHRNTYPDNYYKPTKSYKPMAAAETACSCTLDHDNQNNYEAVQWTCYFTEKSKALFGSKCHACPADTSIIKVPGKAKSFPTGKEVRVCKSLMMDTTASCAKGVYCSDCFTAATAAGGRGSKRGRSRQ